MNTLDQYGKSGPGMSYERRRLKFLIPHVDVNEDHVVKRRCRERCLIAQRVTGVAVKPPTDPGEVGRDSVVARVEVDHLTGVGVDRYPGVALAGLADIS